MPPLLVDLDKMLIDRAGAFARWTREFAAARGGTAADTAWLVAADRDGLEPRERLAAMIGERFGQDRRAGARLATAGLPGIWLHRAARGRSPRTSPGIPPTAFRTP